MMHGFSMAIILPSFSAHCHPIFSLITNSHSSLSIIHHHSPLSINNNHRMTILSLLAAPSCTAHSPADPKDHIEPRQGPSPPRPTGPGIWTGSQRPRRPLPTWRPPWGSSEVGRPWFAKIVPETWTIFFFSDVTSCCIWKIVLRRWKLPSSFSDVVTQDGRWSYSPSATHGREWAWIKWWWAPSWDLDVFGFRTGAVKKPHGLLGWIYNHGTRASLYKNGAWSPHHTRIKSLVIGDVPSLGWLLPNGSHGKRILTATQVFLVWCNSDLM